MLNLFATRYAAAVALVIRMDDVLDIDTDIQVQAWHHDDKAPVCPVFSHYYQSLCANARKSFFVQLVLIVSSFTYTFRACEHDAAAGWTRAIIAALDAEHNLRCAVERMCWTLVAALRCVIA